MVAVGKLEGGFVDDEEEELEVAEEEEEQEEDEADAPRVQEVEGRFVNAKINVLLFVHLWE